MYRPRTTSMTAALAVVAMPQLAAAQANEADDIAKPARTGAVESRPGWSGVWEPEAWSTDEWPLEPPFNAAGRAAQEAWAANRDDDPSYRCIIPLGRIISAPLPFEVLEQEDRITLLCESDRQGKRVLLDVRGQPHTYPMLVGHSIGRFEGETLVVETANLVPGLLRPQGMPYSGETRLTERLTLLDDGER